MGTGLAPKQFPNYCWRRQWWFERKPQSVVADSLTTASKIYQALWPLKSSVQPPIQSFLISNFPSIQTLAQGQNTVALHIKLAITQVTPLTCGLTLVGAVRLKEAGQHIICGACSLVYHWLIFPAVLLKTWAHCGVGVR